MKKKILTATGLFIAIAISAQIPEEALRLSWQGNGGTARNQAIGGAMVSLGGDATANVTNPAGLAFFKTSDFVLSPAFQFGNDKGIFRGNNTSTKTASKFNLGTTGFVFGGFGRKAKTSLGLTVTQTANFNNKTFYKGQNDYSSFAEPLADEFAGSGFTIDQALEYSNPLSLQTKMAIYTYLVDTATVNGNLQVIARSENTGLRDQENTVTTSGGITEITLGLAQEINKKLMFGGSLGIPILSLNKNTLYTETNAAKNPGDEFNYFNYSEDYSLKGIGLNLRAGFIFRPTYYVRLGLAIQSPSWFTVKETFNADMKTDIGDPTVYEVNSSIITNNQNPENRYILNTPTKISISGSYVLREVADVTKQKGFITADLEYTNYKWMKFSPYDETTTPETFNPYNQIVDDTYKSAFNFKLGGELKFNTIMARAGFAYFGNPYSDKALKGSQMKLSGGLGYRHKGMFFDLTYVHRLNKDVNFPYRVDSPRQNTFANLKDSGGNVLLTLGFKI